MRVILFIIFLAIVAGLGYRMTTAEDRARYLQIALNECRQAREAAGRSRAICEPYREALRARTTWAIVTPILAAANVIVFVLAARASGGGELDALLAWGANLGPRTTNGEWWRLVTAMFVHTGVIQLVINVTALVQIGLILERLVGRLTFTATYIATGVLAALASVSAQPVTVSFGASGAIFGLLGLMVAALWWSFRSESPLRIPTMAIARLAPAIALFVLFNLVNDDVPFSAEWRAFAIGLMAGVVLTRTITEEEPARQHVLIAIGCTALATVLLAVPLRRIADVKPEMERVIAAENRTVAAYNAANEQFRKGKMTAAALSVLIEGTIVPELQTADTRLQTLQRVPAEHQPLVDSAQEYLRLRIASWHFRAEGLRQATMLSRGVAPSTERDANANWRVSTEKRHRANLRTLGQAEGSERASLEALQKTIAATTVAVRLPGR